MDWRGETPRFARLTIFRIVNMLLARPKRSELLTPRFVVWGSIDVCEGCGMAEPASLPGVLVAPRFRCRRGADSIEVTVGCSGRIVKLR
jgi:hypothetical protein